MAKNKKNTTPTDTATLTSEPILDLDAIRALAQDEQVGLYVRTEARQQAGFRLQGKILHTLGSEGTDLLRAAGIRPSSLSNARKAAWMLDTFTRTDLPAPLNRAEFHTGEGEPVPFSEALYDTLTLRQCELIQIGLTSIGTYRHRPSQQTTLDLLARPDWEAEIEHYLDCGMTIGEKAEADAEAARQLAEERQRQEQMRQQIEQQTAELERLRQQQAENPAAAPPPPPVVAFNTTPPAETETPAEQPSNVIPMTAEAEAETETPPETTETPTPSETSAPSDEPVETPETPEVPETIEDEETDPDTITPEDIASAVADATQPIDLDQTLCVIEDDFASVDLTNLDVSDLQDIAARLEAVLSSVRAAITAKAAPQDDLPAQQPKAKRGKKALAAA